MRMFFQVFGSQSRQLWLNYKAIDGATPLHLLPPSALVTLFNYQPISSSTAAPTFPTLPPNKHVRINLLPRHDRGQKTDEKAPSGTETGPRGSNRQDGERSNGKGIQ